MKATMNDIAVYRAALDSQINYAELAVKGLEWAISQAPDEATRMLLNRELLYARSECGRFIDIALTIDRLHQRDGEVPS